MARARCIREISLRGVGREGAPRGVSRSVGLIATMAVAIAGFSGCAPPRVVCPAADTVLVQTRTHRLWLCEAGRARERFAVALGRAGTGKRVEGDNKTPLGTYPLGVPRPSAQFGQFIPVGYPTDGQRSRGLTGGDVGIHGPRRSSRWLGRASVWADWTRGCIALATDGDLAQVARFVLTHSGVSVRIE